LSDEGNWNGHISGYRQNMNTNVELTISRFREFQGILLSTLFGAPKDSAPKDSELG
jgi:hypothetical protein